MSAFICVKAFFFLRALLFSGAAVPVYVCCCFVCRGEKTWLAQPLLIAFFSYHFAEKRATLPMSQRIRYSDGALETSTHREGEREKQQERNTVEGTE